MSTSTDTRVWAELGDWGNGPALVILAGDYGDGNLIDAPTVLFDSDDLLPVELNEENIAALLATQGYREVPGSIRGGTDYGAIIELEQV